MLFNGAVPAFGKLAGKYLQLATAGRETAITFKVSEIAYVIFDKSGLADDDLRAYQKGPHRNVSVRHSKKKQSELGLNQETQ